jgi:uncharacterized protein YjiS (DUF1127 family)
MQSNINAIPFDPTYRAAPRTANPARLFSFALKVFDVIRQRRRLAQLAEDQLADIGIIREEARIEAARPFWDLPADQIGKMNT